MKKWLLVAFLCSMPLAAAAETLTDVLAYTYENSSTIGARRAGQKATDETVAQAKSGYRPNVVAEGNIGRSYTKLTYESPLLGTNTYRQTPTNIGISAVQPVFSGLTTVQSVRSAKNQVKAGRANLLQIEQNVLLNAITAFMNVIRDRAVLDLQINQEKVLAKHLESYKKRFNAGDLTRTDIAQAEARLSGARAARIAAEGNLKISNAVYVDVIGKEPFDLKDVGDLGIILPSSLDEALTLALADNPRIREAQFLQMASKYDVKAREGVLSPSVDVRAAAGRQTEITSVNEQDFWSVKANLSVPLYQSGREYADVRQAKHTANETRILLTRIKKSVLADTTSAWEKYGSTKAQITSIKDQIKASKTALDGVIREADVGQRTVLDVLDAEQEHLDNQVDLVRAHNEEVISAFALMRACGRLTPQGLNLPIMAYDSTRYYKDVKNKWIGWGIDDDQ